MKRDELDWFFWFMLAVVFGVVACLGYWFGTQAGA